MKDYSPAEILELILAHAHEKILIIDPTGVVLYAAKPADRRLCGKNIIETIGKKHKRRFEVAIQRAIDSHVPLTCDFQGTLGNESSGWFSCRISPLLDEDDEGAILFASDITERRAKDLKKKKKERQKLDKHSNYQRAVENILTMCCETKNVQFGGEWLSIEEFLWKQYGFQVSHGLSPQAYKNAVKQLKEYKNTIPKNNEG